MNDTIDKIHNKV